LKAQGHPIRYLQVRPKRFLLCQILDMSPALLPLQMLLQILPLLLVLMLRHTLAVLVALLLRMGQAHVEAASLPQRSRYHQVEQCHLSRPA